MKQFIKKNFTKIIISMSIALSCLCVFFGISKTYAFDYGSKDFDINSNYQEVSYSNTINITNTLQFETPNIDYYINDSIVCDFTTNKNTEFDCQPFGFNFITKYRTYDNTRNFLLENDLFLSLTFDIKKYVNVNGGEYIPLSFDDTSPYYYYNTLFDDFDFESVFGIYDSYASVFTEIGIENNNYFYVDDDATTIHAFIHIPYNSYMENLSFSSLNIIYFGFNSSYYKENNIPYQLEIYNIDIGNFAIFNTIMDNYKYNFNTLNNNYNELQENYNELQDNYNELQNKYNEEIQAYNDIINGELPFRESNIQSVNVSVSNIGNISDDYDHILIFKDKQLEIDSGAVRDIVDAYNVPQNSNTSINIVLQLKSPINLYYLFIKVNSSEFEYSFSFNSLNTVKDYVAMTSTYGDDANGEYVNSNVNNINRIIITISNVDNTHYADTNTYIQTNATYFDGYAQAYKELSDEINGYKQQNDSLRETISNNNRSISVLRQEVSDLQEQVSNNFGFKNIFFAIADTPFKTASNFLGFELFGIDLFQAFIGFITVLACIWLIKKLI